MKHRKTLLSASVFAALCFAGAAVAQDAGAARSGADPQSDASDATRQLGTIEIHGIRGSLVQSLATKRSANSIVDAITAEDIGRFPSTNVAEALTQVPGVTLDRKMPAIQRVSINGLDPQLNLTLLDGHPVAQAIWLFAQSPNRGFNFSLLPSELVGKLEVYKSSEARLPAGGLGGTIIVHTREPLDLDPNTLAGSVSYGYNTQASDGKPSISLFYSTRNADGTFGFNVSAQHYEQVIDRQGREIFGYHPVADYAAASPAIAAEVAAGKLKPTDMVPDEINAAHFQQTEKRDSIYVNLQFKPTDNFKSNVALMYWKDNLDSLNQSLYNFVHSQPQHVTSLGSVKNGVVNAGSSDPGAPSPCQADFAGVCPTSGTFMDNQARPSEITTKGIDWKLSYTGDDWGVSGQLGFNDSYNTITQSFQELNYEGGMDWTIQDGWTFHDPAARNPAFWFVGFGNSIDKPYGARDQYAQVDFSNDLNGFFNELLYGVRFARHWENQSAFVHANPFKQTLTQLGFGGITDLSGMSDFSDDMQHHVQTSGFGAILAAADGHLGPVENANFFYNNTFKVRQTHTAAYLQGNFTNNLNIRGNVGVRVVRTKTDAHGYDVPGDCTTFDCGVFALHTKTDTDVLPAFNIAYTLAPDFILRGAASETVAYNPYNQLAPFFSSNDTVLTASAGNPDLDPYKSVNLSVSAEWYFAHASLLAVSVFNKNINNFVETKAKIVEQRNVSFNNPGFNQTPLIATGQCTTAGICRYSVTSPVNGGHGRITGFNLNYQQAFGNSGFGLRANYTYSDGSTSEGHALPYNSKNAYNISPYYEQGRISASIAYGYRSEYLAGGYVAGAPPATVDNYYNLNASVAYALTPKLTLQLSGLNLLDYSYLQYLGTKDMPVNKYKIGTLYQLSLHFKF